MCYIFFSQENKKITPLPSQTLNRPLIFFQALKCLYLKGFVCSFFQGHFLVDYLKDASLTGPSEPGDQRVTTTSSFHQVILAH